MKIFWRGKHDFHVTMSSTSPPNATRWGSSVQLTQRGINAVERFWGAGIMKKVFAPQECIKIKINGWRKSQECASSHHQEFFEAECSH